MAVEEAQHILSGDHIQTDERGPVLEVVATDHSPRASRLSVLSEGSEYKVLVFLPDDPVFVSVYSDAWDEEIA